MPSEGGGGGGGGGLKPTLQPTIPTNSTTPTNPLFRVIPTKVGIQNVKSKETFFPDKFPHRQTWIPACAGMTNPSARKPKSRHSHESGNLERKI
ncbi:hypothetical protein [Neisseria lactamica]|uniref:hypothetical protein n=1 Tax=Neisseria lactamica TaxID=486 RepID=UPI001EFCB86C|nr:hypothetical protein [Neisseria lactamica]